MAAARETDLFKGRQACAVLKSQAFTNDEIRDDL